MAKPLDRSDVDRALANAGVFDQQGPDQAASAAYGLGNERIDERGPWSVTADSSGLGQTGVITTSSCPPPEPTEIFDARGERGVMSWDAEGVGAVFLNGFGWRVQIDGRARPRRGETIRRVADAEVQDDATGDE